MLQCPIAMMYIRFVHQLIQVEQLNGLSEMGFFIFPFVIHPDITDVISSTKWSWSITMTKNIVISKQLIIFFNFI